MKKTLSILMLGTLPALTLAGGNHAGGHDEAVTDASLHHGPHLAPIGDDAMAYGEPGEAAEVSRVIEVQAHDMRYTPATITVRRGETVKFVVKDTDSLPHEFVLGDAKSLKEHAETMRRYPDMEHDDPNMTKMAPGGTGTLIWKFTRAGAVEFACLIPGHYEAGMKGRIRVSAK